MELLRCRSPAIKVFVATGYHQKADAALLMGELRARNLTISCDWTVASTLSIEAMAARDVEAVRTSDVLVALMTVADYEYKGTFTEIGMAIGAGVPVVVVSPFMHAYEATCAENVYFHCDRLRRYLTVQAFLEALDKK